MSNYKQCYSKGVEGSLLAKPSFFARRLHIECKANARFLAVCFAVVAMAVTTLAHGAGNEHSQSDGFGHPKPQNRAESISAIVRHLGLGEGSVIADLGAGRGQDTWVFARIVGEKGTVFAQEIVESQVKTLEEEASKRGLSQVRAMLGRSDDPCLPVNSTDLVFLHWVYHHFAKPREMLRGIWRTLKPGGYLVVVDRRRGTLRDWVPRQRREERHFWIAETTVVREAREEGFAFVACPDEVWHAEEDFVLIFKRPEELEHPGLDPDAFLPLPVKMCSHHFLPLGRSYQRPVFVALGGARELMAPILQRSSGQGLEVVLEEWATQREERPPLPANVFFPSVLTENGDPRLGSEPVDVVFFLDSYHLLFHGKTLLAKIHEKLTAAGDIYVLDRMADQSLSRREASHRRMIEPETVKQEMAEAGFFLWFEGPELAPDRFLLVFGKAEAERIPPEEDPFIGGPEISDPPGQWLKTNYWRLRGLKTADQRFVSFPRERQKEPVIIVREDSSRKQVCEIPEQRLSLRFEKKDNLYLLTDYRKLDGQ